MMLMLTPTQVYYCLNLDQKMSATISEPVPEDSSHLIEASGFVTASELPTADILASFLHDSFATSFVMESLGPRATTLHCHQGVVYSAEGLSCNSQVESAMSDGKLDWMEL